MPISYETFRNLISREKEKNESILEGIYHRGQDNIWNGQELLKELIDEYGAPKISPDKMDSVKNIFSIILWGEYAAWNVSSQLSFMLDDYGAKMAAVSQAHDEARHFYVMRDYLRLLDYEPQELPKHVSYILGEVCETRDLARKLLGMQLMIEPIALTIFRFIRRENIDPVLSNLLGYFEIDESRHVALGIKHLPGLLKEMSRVELVKFLFWQAKLINAEISGLKFLEKDLIVLGIDPLEAFEFAERKQLECLRLVAQEMGISKNIWKPIVKIIQFKKKMTFYPDKQDNFIKRFSTSLFEMFGTT
jgi:hypothetical protein